MGKYESKVNEIMEKLNMENSEQQELASNYTSVTQTIQKKKNQLRQEIEPKFVESSTLVAQLDEDLVRFNSRLNELYEKQARGSQYKSIEERNTYIEEVLQKEIRTNLELNVTMISEIEEEISKNSQEIQNHCKKLKEDEKNITKYTSALSDITQRQGNLNIERNQLQEEKK